MKLAPPSQRSPVIKDITKKKNKKKKTESEKKYQKIIMNDPKNLNKQNLTSRF